MTLFPMAALGAGKSNRVRRQGPWLISCVDRHWPRATFRACDQQLIRLHCANSSVVSCGPMEAAEEWGKIFDDLSPRIEIVMVMNSQPTLHDTGQCFADVLCSSLSPKNNLLRTGVRERPRSALANHSLQRSERSFLHTTALRIRFRLTARLCLEQLDPTQIRSKPRRRHLHWSNSHLDAGVVGSASV
jgi:hypothetical protein